MEGLFNILLEQAHLDRNRRRPGGRMGYIESPSRFVGEIAGAPSEPGGFSPVLEANVYPIAESA